jgi:hypothetical protein
MLGSSTEDSLGHMSDQSRTPVSPEEQFRPQRMSKSVPMTLDLTDLADYPQLHGHDQFGHPIDGTGLKTSDLSQSSGTYQINQFFAASEAHRLHGSHQSLYGTQNFHSPSSGAHEQAFFPPQHHVDGNELGWASQGAERTASNAAGDDSYRTFGTNRANSFPTLPSRRFSSPHDMNPDYPALHAYSPGAEYQQHMLAQQYAGNAQYANMGWAPQSNARMPSLPSSTNPGFTQPWYNTPLSYVREEEDAGYTPGHPRRTFQPG